MIDWSLLRSPDIAGAFQTGLQNGQAVAKQRAVDSALSAFAMNPGDRGALSQLMAADSRTGIAIQNQQQDQQRFEATQAANAAKLQQERHEQTAKVLGEAAYDIALRPPAEQAAAWDSYVDQLAPKFPEVAAYRGKFTPEALNGLLAETGMNQKVIDARAPKYVVAPPGGGLVNSNPLSPGFNPGAASPQGMPALPPGFTIDAPGGAPSQGGATFPGS